jgi:hypothetical protein
MAIASAKSRAQRKRLTRVPTTPLNPSLGLAIWNERRFPVDVQKVFEEPELRGR